MSEQTRKIMNEVIDNLEDFGEATGEPDTESGISAAFNDRGITTFWDKEKESLFIIMNRKGKITASLAITKQAAIALFDILSRQLMATTVDAPLPDSGNGGIV